MSLSRKEIDEIKTDLEKICYKVVGSVDDRIIAIFERGLYNGYDKEKFTTKLSSIVEAKKAQKLSEKVHGILGFYQESPKSKKRHHDQDKEDDEPVKKKLLKQDENSETPASNNAALSSNQIKLMMENAQREIEERKKKLEDMKVGKTAEVDERQKKIADLQRQIQAKLSGSLGTMINPINPSFAATVPKPTDKPRPLILDDEGRTVDTSGREINIQTLTPTLKANIRAKKKETFKHQQTEKAIEEAKTTEPAFYDERIMVKPAIRGKRALRFHEPGKFLQIAERLRMKSQLEKLQNEISQIARKTGISSATKLALIAPKTDVHSEGFPQYGYEWWDSVILTDDLNKIVEGKISIRDQAITNLIEHPTQMRPPNDPLRPAYLPVFLTKKERKKLRRQNRREAWKEEQEKIRLGLIDPPEPKLKISNLMRVLGNEAIQDPTKIEAHVREQMARRQKEHEDANQSRKLTDEQKREKKIKKLKEDTSMGVNVSVYRIRDLHNVQSKKFKVETNAKQLFMTGVVILFRDCCVVVVEGGPKQQKRYRRLMMHRIKWEEDMIKCSEVTADGEKEVPNSCTIVWEGKVPRRCFGEIKFKHFTMEKLVREFFLKHHCEHYWDLAYSGAVLEASDM
ncbi:CLUMA_CG000203, isoform A [Clunio marinus]|uniref:CLUMA_CG000203, isoform A n=1 Tax=Clunio marinus TaxID=568069 RepID=A0A1J1HE94_9DIPT|nr:CLUMA_CG000203, isoform A [Clunio marinus]